VKVGQTILYTWGDNITIDGEEYVIVRENEISAIIN
jgi:co-chaperonin GroES (HSP10)